LGFDIGSLVLWHLLYGYVLFNMEPKITLMTLATLLLYVIGVHANLDAKHYAIKCLIEACEEILITPSSSSMSLPSVTY
jgi:hypothetical protein